MLSVTTKRALLLGCGHDRRRRVRSEGEPIDFSDCELTTLDMYEECGADVIHDLNELPLPFDDESFDEIHVYDVLEHTGSQGDWRFWFSQMADLHRLLAPGGVFFAIVPVNRGAFCDPGHVRFFHPNYFGFLTKEFNQQNRDLGTAATDYSRYIKGWWTIEYINEANDALSVVMRKV